MKPEHAPGIKIIMQRSQKSVITGMTIRHIANNHTEQVIKIGGLSTLNILVVTAAPRNEATDRTVKIQDTVDTLSPTFLAKVGKVGPVTLKNFTEGFQTSPFQVI